MNIGEVAAPAAGDENLAPRLSVAFKQQNPASAPAGNSGAHQACSTRSQDNCIEFANLGGHFIIVAE